MMYNPSDTELQISRAIGHLQEARDLLKEAKAAKTLARVRLALSSAKGALRNAQAKPYRGDPQISEAATKLLDACADASFECGEWNADQGEPYEQQYEASSKARDALVAYISGLESDRAALLAACKRAAPYLASHVGLTADEMRGLGGDVGDALALDACEAAIAKAEGRAK